MSNPVCIDLFCGAGGLTHGFVLEGINVVAGIDIDEACKYPYERNNDGARFIKADISDIKPEELALLYGGAKTRILAGCAPCQPFSTYSQKYKSNTSGQWALLNEFGRLVEGLLPEIVTMENVPKLRKHTVFERFLNILKGNDYTIWCNVIDCSLYGLPQRRKRLVLLASRIGKISFNQPDPTSKMTVKQAIGNLPPIFAGSSHSEDPLHTSSRLTKINMLRIKNSRPGGTWRDWPSYLIADCHKKQSGKTYPGVYGRMKWNEPAPALTTQFFGFGNGRFGHPTQNRALSLREGAILQGFPSDYVFIKDGDKLHFTILGRLIGNAVPVTLARIIGSSILNHLSDLQEEHTAAS